MAITIEWRGMAYHQICATCLQKKPNLIILKFDYTYLLK